MHSHSAYFMKTSSSLKVIDSLQASAPAYPVGRHPHIVDGFMLALVGEKRYSEMTEDDKGQTKRSVWQFLLPLGVVGL